jgi:Glycosyltransferase family 87
MRRISGYLGWRGGVDLPTVHRPQPGLLVLAAVGGALLLIVAAYRWGTPSDEFAYWLGAQRLAAGQPLYDPSATLITPYAYLYPPPLAQVLSPFTHLLRDPIYIAGWTVLLLTALLYLGNWSPLRALALVAWLPVALDLWVRNVHLLIAVLIVMGLRGRPWAFALGAAIKIAPALGVIYFISARRWRDALVAAGAGLCILAVSIVLAPGAWLDFTALAGKAGAGSAGILPFPYWVRGVAGIILAIVAGRASPRLGEPLVVLAITIANPSMFATAFAILIAIVPLLRWPVSDVPRYRPALRTEGSP